MFELLLVGGLAILAISILLAAFAAVAFMLRALIWLVLLPVKLLIGLIVGIVVFPIVAILSVVGILIAVVTVGALVAVPLLPLLLAGLLVWALVRAAKPAVARDEVSSADAHPSADPDSFLRSSRRPRRVRAATPQAVPRPGHE